MKAILEKTAMFNKICGEEKDSGLVLMRAIADGSPSQTAVSASVLPDLKLTETFRKHTQNKN